jgi:phage shock protein A
MFISKIWNAVAAQFNKLANFVWRADPMAQLQYEYDNLVDQLKDGRIGLEQYQALVQRVTNQVVNERQQVAGLEHKIRAYLTAGDRETAGRVALELQRAKAELQENEGQLAIHEQAYGNVLLKIQYANRNLTKLRDKIVKYDADLKLSRAEAELIQVVARIQTKVPTDFGQVEQAIQDEIDRNRAKVKVAADLSSEGVVEAQREIDAEKILGEQALRDFEQGAKESSDTARERGKVKQSG